MRAGCSRPGRRRAGAATAAVRVRRRRRDPDAGRVENTQRSPPARRWRSSADAKPIKIGIKFDQPGLGYKKPGTDTPEGFDVEIAKIVAASSGIEPGNIEWVETVSKNREPFLQNGHRRPGRRVVLDHATSGAGRRPGRPVLRDRPAAARSARTTSRSPARTPQGQEGLLGDRLDVDEEVAGEVRRRRRLPFATYSECVHAAAQQAPWTRSPPTSAILPGYAARGPDKLKVVGKPFTEERYGIGFTKGDNANLLVPQRHDEQVAF